MRSRMPEEDERKGEGSQDMLFSGKFGVFAWAFLRQPSQDDQSRKKLRCLGMGNSDSCLFRRCGIWF